jgi:hypothetical protein
VSNLPAALEAVSQQLEASNPDLYRHLALYLQVLRQVLPNRVEQACFHLVTQVVPQRYASLASSQRQRLHERLQSLQSRCSSLLTVEHLATLAHQIWREREKRHRMEQRQLLERLSHPQPPSPGSSAPGGQRWRQPPGSVVLTLAPPPSPGWHRLGGGAKRVQGLSRQDATQAVDGETSDDHGPAGGTPGDDSVHGRASSPDSTAQPSGSPDPQQDMADSAAARAMVRAFSEALAASLGKSDQEDGEPGGEALSPWQQGRLPQDPEVLLEWLDGMDQALIRRLRNLSHAINVELLRLGLTSSLLPVNLLDAVLNGDIETLSAPPNLLRLQLPFGGQEGPSQVETMVVLLRRADLEMEEPKLRTCRRRIEKHREEVRRLARQFRGLRRRLDAHEAERLWLSHIQSTRPSNG